MASHDATYYMSSDLFTLTTVIWFLETAVNIEPFLYPFSILPLLYALLWAFVYLLFILPLLYVLLGRAVNRALYTDVVIFRFATLFCSQAPKRPDGTANSGG